MGWPTRKKVAVVTLVLSAIKSASRQCRQCRMIISLDRRKCCDKQKFQVILKNSSQYWDRKLFEINCHLKTNNVPGRMRPFLWPFRNSKCIAVESQSVNDHPKCEYLVVAYGRWSLTRIEPQGASSKTGLDSGFSNWIPVIVSKTWIPDSNS